MEVFLKRCVDATLTFSLCFFRVLFKLDLCSQLSLGRFFIKIVYNFVCHLVCFLIFAPNSAILALWFCSFCPRWSIALIPFIFFLKISFTSSWIFILTVEKYIQKRPCDDELLIFWGFGRFYCLLNLSVWNVRAM